MKTMLQHLRETADLGQRELAARARVAQETISQLETGKSARPRLDTLTKLRDALELGDMRPEDLLDPSPLSSDPDLASAAALMIRLLKVLPTYHRDDPDRSRFWPALSEHLDYRDFYPATHLTAHLDLAIADTYPHAAAELANYVLMFFNPDNDGLIEILAEHTSIGPYRHVARRWCRDVTDAAWVLHRAAMTSYPTQVAELYAEAGTTEDPDRIRELCASVYASVRGRAYPRAPIEDQIAALRQDPSTREVHYTIAKAGGPQLQQAALEVPTAWPGLSLNPGLDPHIAEQLVTLVLDAVPGPHEDHAGRALFNLAERHDLPRPLLERISTAIDREDRPDIEGGWITSCVLAIRRTLHDLDSADKAAGRRPDLRLVTDENTDPAGWWRRIVHRR